MDEWRRMLDELAEAGLLREPVTVESRQGPRVQIGGGGLLGFCSNNHLGRAGHPPPAAAAETAPPE